MKTYRKYISVITICIMLMLNFAGLKAEAETMADYDVLRDAIIMHTGSSVIYAYNERGQIDEFDESSVPIVENGCVYAPLEFFKKILWTEITYETKTGDIVVEHNGNTFKIEKNSSKMISGDEELDIKLPPLCGNEGVFLPVNVAEVLTGNTAFYDDSGLIVIAEQDISEEKKKELIVLYQDDAPVTEAREIFVSPQGHDSNNGSFEKPFKTIAKAKSHVRDLLKTEAASSDIIVYLRGGVYYLDETLVFTEEDSGNGYNKVIYTAYKDEKPVISGSQPITGWEVYKGDILRTYIGKRDSVHALFENGNLLIKARTPNRTEEPQEWFLSSERMIDNGHVRAHFFFKEGDVPYMKNISDLEIYIYSGGKIMWNQDRLKVTRVYYDENMIKLSRDVARDMKPGCHYFLQGALELLDYPGEFYHDTKAGYLYYYPTDGSLGDKVISVPAVNNLIELTGKSEKESVKNIEFRNLEICNTDRFVADNTHVYNGGNGIYMSNAENINITGCHIHDTGSEAIRINECAVNCRISNNKIENTGHSGIYMVGEECRPLIRNNVIHNNYIHNIGVYAEDGRGVYIKQYGSKNNFIVHNRIDRTGAHNIRIGTAHWRNYAMYNELSDAARTTEDTSVIYSDMQGEGAFISNNFLHDTYSRFGASGIYFDEGTHNCVAQNNIITRLMGYNGVASSSSLFFKGPRMIVTNNFSVNSPDALIGILVGKGSGYFLYPTNLQIDKNIVSNAGGNPFRMDVLYEDMFKVMDNNLYFAGDGKELNFETAFRSGSREGWLSLYGGKLDQNSLMDVSPGFMNADNDDYRLRYDSPAFSLGIRDIDTAVIGLDEGYAFTDKAEPLERIFIKEEGTAKSTAAFNMLLGESKSISVSARSKTGFVMDMSDAVTEYKSDNPSVAAVSQNGAVEAVGKGIAKLTVTASKNGGTDSLDLYVLVDDELDTLSLMTDTNVLQNGQSVRITPVITTKYGQTNKDIFKNVKFTSSNPEVAVVDGTGTIKASADSIGEATVTFSGEFNGKPFKAEQKITVVKQRIKRIAFIEKNIVTNIGKYDEVAFELYDYNDNVITELSDVEFTYETDHAPIASLTVVDKSKIKAVGLEQGIGNVKLFANRAGETLSTSIPIAVMGNEDNLPDGFKLINYGGYKGSVTENNGRYSFITNGDNIYKAKDTGTYLYKSVSDENLTVECNIAHMHGNWNENSAVGPMIRVDDTAASFNVQIRVIPNGKIVMTYRNADARNSGFFSGGQHELPLRLKLEKTGNMIKGYYLSEEGWNLVGEIEVPMGGEYLAGIAGFSNVVDGYIEAQIDDFAIYAN